MRSIDDEPTPDEHDVIARTEPLRKLAQNEDFKAFKKEIFESVWRCFEQFREAGPEELQVLQGEAKALYSLLERVDGAASVQETVLAQVQSRYEEALTNDRESARLPAVQAWTHQRQMAARRGL